MTSTNRALAIPRFKAKHPKLAPLLSLKMPAQAACPVLPKEAPSVLHLIQPAKGGVQITSIILEGFGRGMLTLNRFRMTKSDKSEPLAREVKLPAKGSGGDDHSNGRAQTRHDVAKSDRASAMPNSVEYRNYSGGYDYLTLRTPTSLSDI
jgi:hypothetical protein